MLYPVNKGKFLKVLRSRKLEDLRSIKEIEQHLKRKRGFVFKMPKKGESIILLLSGGMDSVTAWGILMKEFGLHVYPLSFDRGEKRANKERDSIQYFAKFYKEKYPSLYHEPLRINLGLEKISIPIEKAAKMIDPKVIMENFRPGGWMDSLNVSFGSFLLLPIYAKVYAEYLFHRNYIKIRTILCSITLSDGKLVPHQTLTSIRTVMMYLCATTGDYSWQFASAIFEKETGLCYDKSDLAKWAYQNRVPIEKTWSCYHSTKYQCGGADCMTCIARVNAFKIAKVPDLTKYRSLYEQSFRYMVKMILLKFPVSYRLVQSIRKWFQ